MNQNNLKGRIYNIVLKKMMALVTGITLGCSAMVVGLAASPQVSDDAYEQEMYEDIWDVVENTAQQEDLDIMSEYMDAELFAYAVDNADDIKGILEVYCSQDTAFYDVVCDYFSP